MPEYDNTGRAAAWRGEGKKPLKIKANVHRDLRSGDEIEIALWPNEDKSSDRQPDYRGKVQDPWQPSSGSRVNRGRETPPPPDFDDDIPWD